MRQAVDLVGITTIVLFGAVALVSVRQWRRERATTALWSALAFVALAWVVVAGRLLPEDPDSAALKLVERIDLALLAIFPYFFYRFVVAFEAGPRPLARFVDTFSVALVTATFVLPRLPDEGESWPWWFAAYALAFVVHWSILLVIVAARLWRAGRGEASVARRRMQLLGLAAMVLVAALALALVRADDDSPLALAVALLAAWSAVLFLLGFAPPALLRALWRRPEERRLQLATGELMAASTVDDVAASVLPPMARMVGARGVALIGHDSQTIGEYGVIDDAAGDVQRFDFPFGSLVVATSTFAPFFGDEERKLLTALGAFTSLALDRARLFGHEREARQALQRADELKSEFVALAAHELRSPVGTIYGISETIAERGPQLAPETLDQLQVSLRAQIRRLREVVEQLLDLSRLDAEAVEIRPQRVHVRERLAQIVDAVAPLDSSKIGIDADPGLEAEVDVDALDRIVSNLLVNACRYGEAPIVVRAAHEDGTLRVSVEDRGPGVPEEFVPQLFERFARSAGNAGTVTGTGLGLAIARSYARAHHGDVSYRQARPRGASFELTLPTLLPV
ncbi:MAG: sensor histidine kinase [Gaiellaceae bacterium]